MFACKTKYRGDWISQTSGDTEIYSTHQISNPLKEKLLGGAYPFDLFRNEFSKLDYTGMDYTGMGYTGMGYTGMGYTGMDYTALHICIIPSSVQ